MSDVDFIAILKRHEAEWLAKMDGPRKRGGLKDNATSCLYRANAIELARKEIEEAMKPRCDYPDCFCAIKCDEVLGDVFYKNNIED